MMKRRMGRIAMTSLVLCHVMISAYIMGCLLIFDSKSVWSQLQSMNFLEKPVVQSPLKDLTDVFSELVANSSYLVDSQSIQSELIASRIWKLSSSETSHALKSGWISTLNSSSSSLSSSSFKPVIILTYQRCGSSFFGNLFNFDPKALYVFEPLDALYSSLYGTFPGYNVPSDIVTFRNGSERAIPFDELVAVAEFLGDLLSCDVDSLPTALFAHGFWHVGEHLFANKTAASVRLSACTRRTRHLMRQASSMLSYWCGRRLSDRDENRHNDCRRLIGDQRLSYDTVPVDHGRFVKYRHAVEGSLRGTLATTCIPIYRKLCAARPLRVAKLVRASMLSMKPLLDWFPDLRVIHLIRDPRPVALSRRDFHESARAQFTDSTRNLSERMVREASIYCRQVVADVRWRRRLEREYPGRIHQLTYEQLADDPVGRASDIYRFIGETPSAGVLESFGDLASSRVRNSSAKAVSERWLVDKISLFEFERINENCSQLFTLFPEYSKARPSVFRKKDVVLAAWPKFNRSEALRRQFLASRFANKGRRLHP